MRLYWKTNCFLPCRKGRRQKLYYKHSDQMTCFVIEALGRIHKPCGQRSGFKKVLKGQNSEPKPTHSKLKIHVVPQRGRGQKYWKIVNMQCWVWWGQISNCSCPAPRVVGLCRKTRLDTFIPKIAHWILIVLVCNIKYIVTNKILFY